MDENDVRGPDRVDTSEQQRIRETLVHEESPERRMLEHDPRLSTLEKNQRGAGVDNRGAEDVPGPIEI
jgi:hypothetical protein